MIEEREKTRLDKWLWAARFFKTRALAQEAVIGGKVHLNGARTQPGRALRVGVTLTIRKALYEYTVEVLVLSSRRGPAPEARLLYAETSESQEKRETIDWARNAMALPVSHGRPGKRDRRLLNKLREKQVT